MAAKILKKYESDAGSIHPIRLGTDEATAAGAEPSGDIDSRIKVKVSKGNREYGIRPRGLRLARVKGTAPDTFVVYKFLPILTEAGLELAANAVGKDKTVGAIAWKVVDHRPEDF